MAKIHRPHAPKRPTPPPLEKRPTPEKTNPSPGPAPEPVKDHFLREIATSVYQNHPLVMLCTQPQIRSVAAKVPVIKEVADAFCPIVPGAAKILGR